MKKITRSQLMAELIPLPEFGEQERIAAEVKARIALSGDIGTVLLEQIRTINRFPGSLVAAAFDGRQ
jgi:hypothetical protein